jgi:hypothetical protein
MAEAVEAGVASKLDGRGECNRMEPAQMSSRYAPRFKQMEEASNQWGGAAELTDKFGVVSG